MDCIAHQAPLSTRFPRQEYWSGLSFVSPELPNPGIEPTSPVLQADSLPPTHLGSSTVYLFSKLLVSIYFVPGSEHSKVSKTPSLNSKRSKGFAQCAYWEVCYPVLWKMGGGSTAGCVGRGEAGG